MTLWRPALPPGTPRYLGLADAIAGDVAGGVLPPGGRLPTQRQLAARLRLAVSTVTRGYAEAERRGLISSEVGRGTFVRQSNLAPLYPESDGAAIDLRGNFLMPWPLLGELRQGLMRTAETGKEEEIFGYAPHCGLARHRAAGARLAAAAGVPATVCGEIAGRPLEAMTLIALGYRSLSMSPAAIGPVKAMVLSLDMSSARRAILPLVQEMGCNRSLRSEIAALAKAHGVTIDQR
jgi:DNA-binding transcriptional regulator YhcF (GntR family)